MTERKVLAFVKRDEIRALLEKKGLADCAGEIVADIETAVSSLIAEEVRIRRNKKRISANDDSKERRLARDVLSDDQVAELPKWVRDDLESAVLLGKSGDLVKVSDGRKFHRKNRLNELSGGEWTFFLNSVINTRYPTSGPEGFAHHIRRIHPSPKPPQLMKEIIEFFTKRESLVLDFFMGVGGTLLGASLSGRRAVGIDINEAYVDAYKAANRELGLREQISLVGDSRKVLEEGHELSRLMHDEVASLILIDPPYGDMMSREKTGESVKNGGNSAATPFTDLSSDLGNMSQDEFLCALKEMVAKSMSFLSERGHLVVFMKDLQPTKANPNLLHADVVSALVEIKGLNYLGMKIWADQGVNLYPYGYPFSFVSNQIHQYILIFRKS